VNTLGHRAAFTPTLLVALLTLLFVVAQHRPHQASAQDRRPPGGSLPLLGVVPPAPDHESRTRLLRAPSGLLFRVWDRWADGGTGSVLLASSPDGVQWEPLIQLKPEGVKDPKVRAEDGDIAVNEAGEIVVAYRVTGAKHVRLARSSDGGKTWTVPTDNVDLSGRAFAPAVAWGSRRTLLVAWPAEGQAGGRRYEIYTRRSPDGGVTWEPAVLMPQPAEPNGFSRMPRLVGDGNGRFWLLWIETIWTRSALRLVRSEDNGRTWSRPLQVSGDGRAMLGHSIDLAGENHLLITWQDERTEFHRPYRIYATSSKDGGATWSPPVQVDGLAPTSRINALAPSSALTPSGEAWVVWHDNRNGRHDVFVARSPDGGLTWDPPQRVDADPAGTAESRNPQLAVSPDGRVVAVIWEDDRNGFEAIYGRLWVGGHWSTEARLGAPLPPKTAARAPKITATGRDTVYKDAFYVEWDVDDFSRGAARRRLDRVVIRPGS
jgi:hypothetical protein